MSNMWRYIKGSEKDFKGAPDWAMVAIRFDDHDEIDFAESYDNGSRVWYVIGGFESDISDVDCWTLISQRERVTVPQWRYIKGNEEDFAGAPDWCCQVINEAYSNNIGYEENIIGNQKEGDRLWCG